MCAIIIGMSQLQIKLRYPVLCEICRELVNINKILTIISTKNSESLKVNTNKMKVVLLTELTYDIFKFIEFYNGELNIACHDKIQISQQYFKDISSVIREIFHIFDTVGKQFSSDVLFMWLVKKYM